MKTALIIVDMQNDFVEGGALVVKGGLALIPVINKIISELAPQGVVVVTTQDWHPANHSQFKDNGGIWPTHCVAGSVGSDIVAGLDIPTDTIRIFKGNNRLLDGYSGFEGVTDKTEGGHALEAVLYEKGIDTVYVCGIATDYCVKATALDALKAGFRVYYLYNASVGVSPETVAKAEIEMNLAGIQTMRLY